MAKTIMQGDSYPIFFRLTQNGTPITPEILDDLEFCIGESLRMSYADGSVKFDNPSKRWYIWPTQEQTFELEEGVYIVQFRVKYKNKNTINVKGETILDKIKVKSAASREVL